MKFNYLLLRAVFALLSFKADSPTEIIELPITLVNGYGTSQVGFGALGGKLASDNPWIKTMQQEHLKGIPKDWSNSVIQYIWFDSRQFALQNYKQSLLSETFFNEIKLSWNIDYNKRPFSESPIKCFVYVVYGKDKNGIVRYKVDTNNNLDFTDDVVYSPVKYDWEKKDSLARNFSLNVKYEAFRNGKIVDLISPLLIVDLRGDGSLWRNIPQHAEAELNGIKILISSDRFLTNNYETVSIYKESIEEEHVGENEFILIGNDTYQNLGVNIDKQVLILKRLTRDTIIYSSQVGFNAKPFMEKEFSTQETITLESYRGKFLYMEFWGSWCGPCINELPELKRAYSSVDKSKIEFLGVANDKSEPFKKILKKEGIEWRQIMREVEDGIIDDYNVRGYPTSFLIDPKGKIVAKNLRGEKLLDTLNYYIKNKRE